VGLIFFGRDRRPGEERKARMHPSEQAVHEALRETLSNVKAAEQEAAKDLAYGCRVERGQLEELPIATEDSIGNQGVQMWVKIGSE
jgi:hypothetical protein